MMSNTAKRECLQTIHQRYRTGPKGVKTLILAEFCRVCGYNRKYAIRLLNGTQRRQAPAQQTQPHEAASRSTGILSFLTSSSASGSPVTLPVANDSRQ